MSTAPRPPRRFIRRAIQALLAVITLASLMALLGLGLRMVGHLRDNATIEALAAGRDVPVSAEASARVLLARAYFLMTRDRLDEAHPLVELLARRGAPALAAAGWYDLGNARLASAIDHLERTQIDPAVPQVRLAKAAYRAALTLDPGLWDAKYNLDIALRLVRDFPEMERELKDEPQEAPKRVWTDLPGLPKGLP